jgi:hypothetical protein
LINKFYVRIELSVNITAFQLVLPTDMTKNILTTIPDAEAKVYSNLICQAFRKAGNKKIITKNTLTYSTRSTTRTETRRRKRESGGRRRGRRRKGRGRGRRRSRRRRGRSRRRRSRRRGRGRGRRRRRGRRNYIRIAISQNIESIGCMHCNFNILISD